MDIEPLSEGHAVSKITAKQFCINSCLFSLLFLNVQKKKHKQKKNASIYLLSSRSRRIYASST